MYRKTTPWPLAKLKDHPLQAKMFGDVNDVELDILAADIEANGLKHAIEILPDGTIVCGHQRVRAARKLGWTTIDAVVRADLAEAGEAAIAIEFVKDNLLRRQLGALGKARCIQQLIETAKKFYVDTPVGDCGANIKDTIADRLGQSRRTVNRYLQVLKTPPAIQNAFDASHLSLVEACQVAMMPEKAQLAVAARIEGGLDPKKALKEAVQANPNPRATDQAFSRLIRAIRRDLPHLQEHEEKISPRRICYSVETLEQACGLFQELLNSKNCEDS
ncbi:MAG: ParB/RepB/Spo0J family partition protein [Planctomycetes bacterium]|nr:ParB/RepB/Spo0J family partition protein [Planctomycetota bacterium]